jgi:uncharacterized membrane protein YccC
MSSRVVAWLERAVRGDWNGLHLAANVFIATTLLWLLLGTWADLNPIWAISSMVAASDPVVKQAAKTFRGRMVNSLVGSAVGMLVLLVEGPSAWQLPIAMSAAVIVSSYIVRQPTMFRQAPITAAIVIAAGLEKHSKLSGVELGVRRVGEVLLGCVVGILVSWAMARLWPLPPAPPGSGKSQSA